LRIAGPVSTVTGCAVIAVTDVPSGKPPPVIRAPTGGTKLLAATTLVAPVPIVAAAGSSVPGFGMTQRLWPVRPEAATAAGFATELVKVVALVIATIFVPDG